MCVLVFFVLCYTKFTSTLEALKIIKETLREIFAKIWHAQYRLARLQAGYCYHIWSRCDVLVVEDWLVSMFWLCVLPPYFVSVCLSIRWFVCLIFIQMLHKMIMKLNDRFYYFFFFFGGRGEDDTSIHQYIYKLTTLDGDLTTFCIWDRHSKKKKTKNKQSTKEHTKNTRERINKTFWQSDLSFNNQQLSLLLLTSSIHLPIIS